MILDPGRRRAPNAREVVLSDGIVAVEEDAVRFLRDLEIGFAVAGMADGANSTYLTVAESPPV
jgi:hypothetical protein